MIMTKMFDPVSQNVRQQRIVAQFQVQTHVIDTLQNASMHNNI